MPSTVSSKGESSFELVPPGTHYAVCARVYNLGQQTTKFGTSPKHYIGFEVPSVRVAWEKDGVQNEGPAFIGARYTSSLSPKAILRQHLEAWRGRAFTEEELESFDLFKLLNVSAMLSVVHSEDGKYANISAIMGMPQGVPKIDAEGEVFGYDPTSADSAAVFAKLSDGFQKTILRGQAPIAPAVPPTPPPGVAIYPTAVPSVAPTNGHLTPPATRPPAPGADDFDDDIPF
jgi:hypothetical protein